MALTRSDVLEEALRILDEHGFPDLTMRRLAGALGVQPSALYWHFANKQTLLTAIAEAILAAVQPRTRLQPWDARILEWAHQVRAALLRHRDGGELVAAVMSMRPESVEPTAEPVRILIQAGLRADAAEAGALALLHFVLGHTVDEQSHAVMRRFGVTDVADEDLTDDRFSYGLELLVDGLRMRVAAESGTAPQPLIGLAGCAQEPEAGV